jgi:hypothetical protein
MWIFAINADLVDFEQSIFIHTFYLSTKIHFTTGQKFTNQAIYTALIKIEHSK